MCLQSRYIVLNIKNVALEHTKYGSLQVWREEPLQQQLSAVSTAGCCAPPVVMRRKAGAYT